MRRAIIAFFPAVFGAYLLASILATQTILARIESMGVPVTLRDRLQASFHDIYGLAASYLPLMLVAYVLALPVAAGIAKYLPRLRVVLYGVAGASALISMHLLIKAILGLNGLAAVRDLNGLLLQGVAGWFGGYLFFVFTGRAHR